MIKVERFNGSQPLEMEMVRKIDFYLTPLLYCLLTTAARLHQLKRHKVLFYKNQAQRHFRYVMGCSLFVCFKDRIEPLPDKSNRCLQSSWGTDETGGH